MKVDSLTVILQFKNGPLRPQKEIKKNPTSLYLDDCSKNYNCFLWENETEDKFYSFAPVYYVCLMKDNMFAQQLQNKMNHITKTLV